MRATLWPRWLRLGSLAAPCLAAACSCGADERTPPEHVLLILVDTLRADHVGSYGHPRSPTPAIDSVAARGVRFAEAYAQSSWTSPSMVSIFTSRYLADTRFDVPAELPTLAESFQGAGWATGAFIMNDMVNAAEGFARGFDHFVQMQPYSDNGPILEWLASNRHARAFTYVHLNEAHDPYEPPEPYRVWRKTPDPVSNARRQFYESVQRELELTGQLEAEVRHIETEIGGYLDDVRYTDERIGGLLSALAANQLAERTCVVITADHGEGLWTRVAVMAGQRNTRRLAGEPPTLSNTLMPTHGNQVNRELVHVPWIMSAPGLPAGAVVEGPVELVDLFPTLLEICDLPIPHGLQGTSRVASIAGRAQAPAEAFSHTSLNSTLITPDGWQVIVPTDLGECEEGLRPALYHLGDDPEARIDRALEQPERLAQLVERVLARRASGLWLGGGPRLDASPATLAAIEKLGYVESGVVAAGPPAELLELPIEELAARATPSGYVPCPERLALARALAARKDELDPTARERVRERLRSESSAAVRAALAEALE